MLLVMRHFRIKALMRLLYETFYNRNASEKYRQLKVPSLYFNEKKFIFANVIINF